MGKESPTGHMDACLYICMYVSIHTWQTDFLFLIGTQQVSATFPPSAFLMGTLFLCNCFHLYSVSASFPVARLKCFNRCNLRKERFILVYSLRFLVFFLFLLKLLWLRSQSGKSLRQLVPLYLQPRNRDWWVLVLCLDPLLSRIQDHNPGNGASHSGLTFVLQLMESR